MGLFFKSDKEKELDKFVGDVSLRTFFMELLRANNLNNVIENKGEFCIGHDIKEILRYKVENGRIGIGEVEAEFYLLMKQFIYLFEKNELKANNTCQKCNQKISSNHSYICKSCNHIFLENYEFDYNELIKTKIIIPSNERSPYKNFDKELKRYILEKKPKSITNIIIKKPKEITFNQYCILLNSLAYYIIPKGYDLKIREEYTYNNKTKSYDEIVEKVKENGMKYKADKHIMVFVESLFLDNEDSFFPKTKTVNKKKYSKQEYLHAIKDVINYRSIHGKDPKKVTLDSGNILNRSNNNQKTGKVSSSSHLEDKKSMSEKDLVKYLNDNKDMEENEKFELLAPIYAKKLGVSKKECFMGRLEFLKMGTQILDPDLTQKRDQKAVAISISNDKISYIIIGAFPFTNGWRLNVFNISDEILHIYFNNVINIRRERHNMGYELQMSDGFPITLKIRGKKFSKILTKKFDEYQTNKNKPAQTSDVDRNIDPLAKIKEAKELLDMGAITPDEFDEIKAKYLKQI